MKLGCLPYLNVKPLIYSMERGQLPWGWDLIYALPSSLAAMLASEQVTAAPVSSFATFIQPDLKICPGICIAADGPVQSVIMVSKVEDISLIKSVALDTSSLSGANMLKIILDEIYGIRPEYISMPPNPVSDMLVKCDAAMVIGDPAMQLSKQDLFVMDIAEEWKKLTDLPAVFAVWAGKFMTPEMITIMQEAKAAGMNEIDRIATAESFRLQLPYELCEDYLLKTIIYDMGDREMAGLEMFKQKCIEHKLVPKYQGGA